MFDLYGSYFTFGGISSESMDGLVFANADTDRFIKSSGDINGVYIFDKKNKKNYLIDDDYSSSPLSFDTDIVTCDGELIKREDERKIEKWLFNHPKYRKLRLNANLIGSKSETTYTQTVPAGGHGVEMESVGGRSVVWNQLVTNGNFVDESGWSVDNATLSVENSVCEISYSTIWGEARQPIQVKSGHKYYISLLAKKPFAETVGFGLGDGANVATEGVYIVIPQSSDFSRVSKIGTFTDKGSDTNRVLIKCMGTIPSDSMFVKSVVVIDLTLLFGSGNEPATTSDPRIAWIEAYAEENPEYNAGEVIHGKVEKIEEEGKNIHPLRVVNSSNKWRFVDYGEAEFVGSTTGYVVAVEGVDKKLNLIEGETYTLRLQTDGSVYFAVRKAENSSHPTYEALASVRAYGGNVVTKTFTYHHDQNNPYVYWMIQGQPDAERHDNVSWKNAKFMIARGSTAPEFIPYHKTTYPIPAEVQALEGYGWSAGSVCNEIDFKRKKFIKRVGKHTFTGSEGWFVNISDTNGRFTCPLTSFDGIKRVDSSVKANWLIADYVTMPYLYVYAHTSDKIIGNNSYDFLVVWDSTLYPDLDSFKAFIVGKELYYELATPIETDISAYIDDSWQAIPTEPNGSLTFTNDYLLSVPVKTNYYDSDIAHQYLNCRLINPRKIENGNGLIGYTATLEADSGLLWENLTTRTYTFSSSGTNIFTVDVDTDATYYTYPKITITTNTGSTAGDIIISNTTDDSARFTKFVSIPAGSTIIIDSARNYISDDYYDYFEIRNFPRLVDGDNSFIVQGNVASVKVEWQNRRRF